MWWAWWLFRLAPAADGYLRLAGLFNGGTCHLYLREIDDLLDASAATPANTTLNGVTKAGTSCGRTGGGGGNVSSATAN
jgi:hypothetical protein